MSSSNTQKPALPNLSPTNSQQTPEYSDATMADAPDSPVQTSSQPFHSPQHSQGSRANGAEKSGAPGSSWNTKKFNEEYDRAMMGVLDKEWDHTKYGDVLMS